MNDLILSEADALLLDEQLRPIPPASPFPYLLFHTLTGCFPFVKIEEDLARINDYLCTCETHLQNQLKQYRTQQKPPAEDEDLLGGRSDVRSDLDDRNAEPGKRNPSAAVLSGRFAERSG